MFGKEIADDVDATIDQLLENQQALEKIEGNPLFSQERTALERAQESLLAHLTNMEGHLEKEPVPRKRNVASKLSAFKKRSRRAVRIG